jgi:diacylglycerol O-acyltransferase
MGSDRLSSLDVSFLCLERPGTPMHMGAVAVFAPTDEFEVDAVLAELAGRAERIPRLRRLPRDLWGPPGRAAWVDDPDFDPARHITHRRLRPPGARSRLAGLVAEIMAEPLDRTRPLWEIHAVTGLANGCFALLLKLHHALADGLGAVEIGAGLLDPVDVGIPARQPAQPSTARSSLTAALASVLRPPGPREVAGTAAGLARSTGRGLAAGAVLTHSLLRHKPGFPPLPAPEEHDGVRGFAMARLALEDVRRVRQHRGGGTANDVLLTVIAGALRGWLIELGEVPVGRPVRAMVPVSRRRRAEGPGNQFGVYTLDLPVGEPNAARRLREVRRQMQRNKAGEAPPGPGDIVGLAELVPPLVHRFATPLAARHANRLFDTVVTSVPMPRGSVHFAGAELRELFPVVPLAAGHPVGIALSTYRDSAYIGIHADPTAAPHVRRLAGAIPKALAELDQTTRRVPGGAARRGRTGQPLRPGNQGL